MQGLQRLPLRTLLQAMHKPGTVLPLKGTTSCMMWAIPQQALLLTAALSIEEISQRLLACLPHLGLLLGVILALNMPTYTSTYIYAHKFCQVFTVLSVIFQRNTK